MIKRKIVTPMPFAAGLSLLRQYVYKDKQKPFECKTYESPIIAARIKNHFFIKRLYKMHNKMSNLPP